MNLQLVTVESNTSNLLQIIKDTGDILIALCTLLAVFWAIFIYINEERKKTIANFQNNIMLVKKFISELSYSLLPRINVLVWKILSSNNQNFNSIMLIGEQTIHYKDKESMEKYILSEKDRINNYVLQIMEGEYPTFTYKLEQEFIALLPPLYQLPHYAYLFFLDIGSIAIQYYQTIFYPTKITDCLIRAIATVWIDKMVGKAFKDKESIRVAWGQHLTTCLRSYEILKNKIIWINYPVEKCAQIAADYSTIYQTVILSGKAKKLMNIDG
jgi:hypothetical protein